MRNALVARRPRLTHNLYLPLRHQRGQPTLQGASLQAVTLRCSNGFYPHAIGLHGDQRKQLIKLSLGGNSWHVFWF